MELVVVESGFSVWSGYDPGINAAAIVENPSDQTAVRPRLHVEFLNGAGAVIDERDATLEVFVPPGRIAVRVGGPKNTASMEVRLSATEWTDDPPLEVTTSDVELRDTGSTEPVKVDVVGTLQNTSDSSIRAVEVIAVLRDADGKILGGGDNLDMPLGPRAGAPFEVHFVGIPSGVAGRVVKVGAYPVVQPNRPDGGCDESAPG